MKIAILDYLVTPTNPAGSCHRQMLESLCDEHEFTVFSVAFENPRPDRIEWVRVPAPRRPLALLFIVFHLLCPVLYWLHIRRKRIRFDLVQGIESNTTLANVAYAHFCHAVYLRDHWSDCGMSGLRRLLRFLDHKLHAWMEPIVYRRSECVVVPSWGLARELAEEYPWLEQRIAVISNPVSLHRWIKPSGFDPKLFRRAKGLGEDSFVLAFVALGQFERKGLPLLIEALALQDDRQLELLVVGGDDGALEPYRDRCRAIGLADRVHFTGMRRDIRPYLWAADAFVLPSSYEVFPLVCLQAAAASLPLLASHLHGVEEFLTDGCNGILVERTVTGIHSGIAAARELAPEDLRWMGKQARCDVERFGERPFSAAWSELYASFSPEPPAAMTQGA